MAIVVSIAGVVWANSNILRRQVKINNSASVILSAAEDMRNRAVAGRQLFTSGRYPSYGLYFDSAGGVNSQVTLYADCFDDDNGDGRLTDGDSFIYKPLSSDCTSAPNANGLIETRAFDLGVTITELRVFGGTDVSLSAGGSPVPKAYITFVPPQPSIWISDNQSPPVVLSYGRLQITIKDSSSAKTKVINLWTNGRMDIE